MKLSICIPTYNRARHLTNCLHSIAKSNIKDRSAFEVCVSDNCSPDNTEEVVRHAQLSMDIRYQKNASNVGIPRNFLNVVNMARGEFVWLLGDDDLVSPGGIESLLELINKKPAIDFFYINSFHLTTDYVLSFPQPFNTDNLPEDMKPFSSRLNSGELKFIDLIDPNVSFDFLGGMFLAVFRRESWLRHANVLNTDAIHDSRTFSHFDNTFPHVKIFANAFAKSRAYFHAKPLSVCLTGAREWSPMYPLVASVRLVEALEEYRRNGLSFGKYWRCRNYALHNFIPDMGAMFVYRDCSGFAYINPAQLVMSNCLYPNFYLSVVYFAIRKLRLLARKLVGGRAS